MKNENSQIRKMLMGSIGTFLIAILAMATVVYAWYAIADNAKGGFIGVVGIFDIDYGFSQIVDGELKDDDGFNLENVVPGKTFNFMLIIGNDTDKIGTVSASITSVNSYIYDGDHRLTDVYERPEEKIQYSYTYMVTEAYWIPLTKLGVDRLQIDTDETPRLPTDEQASELGWIKWTVDEKMSLYNFGQPNHFNKTPDEGMEEIENYYTLCTDISLNPAAETPSATDKHAFVLFFEIAFSDTAVLPQFLIDEGKTVPESAVYQSQRLLIDHIIIVTKENG